MKIILIIIFSLAIVLIFILYKYCNYYYPEKFRISGYEAKIYGLDHKDENRCYVFKENLKVKDTNGVFVLAIRFDIDYISYDHENFITNPYTVAGALGHVDTIQEFHISTKAIPNIALKSAKEFTSFYVDSIDLSRGHHSNGRGCYVGQSFSSLQSFVTHYNKNEPSMVVDLNDVHLFLLEKESVNRLFKDGLILSLTFKNGRNITKIIGG